MFKNIFITFSMLCCLITANTTFTMETSLKERNGRLKERNGRIFLDNEADFQIFETQLQHAAQNDDSKAIKNLYGKAFGISGINSNEYKNKALEAIFRATGLASYETIEAIEPLFRATSLEQDMQNRLSRLQALHISHLQEEEARAKVQAQEIADAKTAEFSGSIESLQQRLDTLNALSEDGIIRLQQDIDLTISLFHDQFVRNTTMPEGNTALVTHMIQQLQKDLKRHNNIFTEQTAKLAPFCHEEASASQPSSSYHNQTTYAYEQDEENIAGPSSSATYQPDDVSAEFAKNKSLVDIAINSDNHEFMRDLLDGLPNKASYDALKEDLQRALALHPKARQYNRQYFDRQTREQELQEAYTDTSAPAQPSSSQNNSHFCPVVDQNDPELQHIVQEAIENNNHELLYDIRDQLTANHPLRALIERALAPRVHVHAQLGNERPFYDYAPHARINEDVLNQAEEIRPEEPRQWFSRPMVIRVGATAAIIGAYLLFKKSR